jgi:hypothetical protein
MQGGPGQQESTTEQAPQWAHEQPTAPSGPAGPQGMAPPPGGPPATQQTSPLAIAALVVGIASCCLIFLIPYVGILVPVAAIVLGVMGMRQCDQDPTYKGRGMAMAGLILGIVFAAIALILLIVGLIWGEAIEQWLRDMQEELEEGAATLTTWFTTR